MFDNRLTLTFQIGDDVPAREPDARDDQIGAEIALSNELMPTETSLAATLFIPLPPGADARVVLGELVGLDEHVILHVGSHALRAAFEPGRSEADRISAVQYARFPLSPEALAALRTPATNIAVEIDHPRYLHRVQCSDVLRASLAADYGDPGHCIDEDHRHRMHARDRLRRLARAGRARDGDLRVPRSLGLVHGLQSTSAATRSGS